MPKPADFGKVIFMRHPETRANIEFWMSGQSDVELSELGKEQCKQAIEAGIAYKPDRVFCSPLLRTQAIAKPVAEALGVSCTVDERLNEIDFGPYEGVFDEDAAKQGIVFPWSCDENGVSQPPEGAESFEHIIARAKSFVDDVAKYPGKTLCVTHGGLTRAVFAAVYNIPTPYAWAFEVFNVTSQVFLSNGKKLYLCSCGLEPKELLERSQNGEF